MKKMVVIAAAAVAFGALADDAVTFVKGENGFSYILVNQNLDSFKFDISKYGEATAADNPSGEWGEGHFSYYTYKGDVVTKTTTTGYGWNKKTSTSIVDKDTNKAVEMTTIEKGTESVDFGAVAAGTKIGFAFDDRGEAEWAYSFSESGQYGNGTQRTGRHGSSENVLATYNAGDGEVLVDFSNGSTSGSNVDDWMAITVSYKEEGGSTNGAPLPGVLAALAVGLFGAGAMKVKAKKRA